MKLQITKNWGNGECFDIPMKNVRKRTGASGGYGMYLYAVSDIHGCLDEFNRALSLVDLSGDNRLILLGDYIHGPDSYGVLDRIMGLQRKYGSEKVIALMGNHEEMALNGDWPIDQFKSQSREEPYLRWMKRLPFYYVERDTIFVHAGIDEEAEDLWEFGTGEHVFLWKYPAQTGRFYGNWKIVAGHVGTAEISGDRHFHDIYYDGESHYYIDGTVLESGILPVIKVQPESGKYYRVTESGDWLILPYQEEN